MSIAESCGLELRLGCMERFFAALNDGALLLEHHRILSANATVCSMFGFRRQEELIGLTLDGLLLGASGGGDEGREHFLLPDFWHFGAQKRFEWHYGGEGDAAIWFECLAVPLDDRLLCLLVRDISRRKTLELRLQRQERQMVMQSRLAQAGEMLSMIAHQWRQPLGAVASTVATLQTKLHSKELICRSARESAEGMYVQERLARIAGYMQHLAHTIDDFRSFFKPDRGKSHFRLRHALEKALSFFTDSFEHYGIEVVRHLQDDGAIESYENELTQVFMNLLGNAKEALMERATLRPRITVELVRVEDLLIASIGDNAGGIAPEHLERIFDPYFSTKANTGSGLGLYMSKTIIEEHCKGNLFVQNEEEGAKFSVILHALEA
ncbi:MAG: hypothetical protein JXK05_02670 [Campylobacterales bacterium]|nr:hypothetical protein [Campylobacterales bacterium]